MSEKLCKLYQNGGGVTGADMQVDVKSSYAVQTSASESPEKSVSFTAAKKGKVLVYLYTSGSAGNTSGTTTYYVKTNNVANTPESTISGNIVCSAYYCFNVEANDVVDVYLKKTANGTTNSATLFVGFISR